MVSAVGLSAASCCAAMRAGVSMFEELPYRDNDGSPIVGARVPGVDPELGPGARMIELLAKAIADCVGRRPEGHPGSIPLLIVLPERDRPGVPPGLAADLLAKLPDKLGLRGLEGSLRILESGHTGAFEALQVARELLARGSSACLVAGVDSFLRARSLLWLDEHMRLKTPKNPDGVVPGEAAAAVLLASAPGRTDAPSVRVSGLGFATEAAHVLSEEPLLGLGMTAAARAALGEAGIGMHEIALRVADVAGEAYGFKELVLCAARLIRQGVEQFPLLHPAESIGDVGAAAGCVAVIVARDAMLNGSELGKVLCSTASVAGARAVAVLERTSTPSPDPPLRRDTAGAPR
jgi:3-oxoacyl-[acyl-carrier-protein] synthase-1